MLSKEEGGSKGKKQRKVAGDQGVQRDCVRVKARRGQATDSHSLAERARRAKISMRMKLLQSLVPGCDQITGKAQILDEIIKYVQLLQNQVECLAAKLAFVDLVLYDCKLNPSKNLCASDQGLCCLEPPLPSVPESIYIFRSSADAATTSPSLLITEDQNASLIPQPQDDGNLYFENIAEQHAGLDN